MALAVSEQVHGRHAATLHSHGVLARKACLLRLGEQELEVRVGLRCRTTVNMSSTCTPAIRRQSKRGCSAKEEGVNECPNWF